MKAASPGGFFTTTTSGMKNHTIIDWPYIKAWADEEVARLRERNDAVSLSQEETAAIRGELRALKRLLDLPELAARKVPQDLLGH